MSYTINASKMSLARGYADVHSSGPTFRTVFLGSRYNAYGAGGASFGNDVVGNSIDNMAWYDSQTYRQRDASCSRMHLAFTIPNISSETILSIKLRIKPTGTSGQTIFIVKNLTGAYTCNLNNYADVTNGAQLYGSYTYYGGSDVIDIPLTNVLADIPINGGTFKMGARLTYDWYASWSSNDQTGSYGINLSGMTPQLIIETPYIPMPSPPTKNVMFSRNGMSR